MKYCKNCVMPDTKPGIKFNSDGICYACLHAKKKKNINWKKRKQQLHLICDQIRGKNKNGYDCIVPVSGGKDSIFQVYIMSEVYNLKTLAVSVPAHLLTKEGIINLNSLVSNLSVDLIKITLKPSMYKNLKLICLNNLGNPAYADHRSIFSGVMRTAINFRIPLVVWGEDIGIEFGGNVDKKSLREGSALRIEKNDLFNGLSNKQVFGNNYKKQDFYFYDYPTISELKKYNIRSIYLSHFFKWDGYKNFCLARKFGFKERPKPLKGNILNYDNIDEKLCELYIWLKMLKFGFWRPTDQACYQIWNNRMTRNEAVELVLKKQYEFPDEYLPEFLHYHSLKESELYDIFEKWRNKDIWVKKNNRWKLRKEVSKI